MPELRLKDFNRLFGTLVELYRIGTLEEWVAHLLPSLRALIASDRATYNELRYGPQNRFTVRTDYSDTLLFKQLLPVFEQYGTQHPSAEYIRKSGSKEAHRWSDFEPPSQFQRTPLYNEYFKPIRTKAQLGIGLSIHRSLLIPVAVNRSHGDFSSRDKLVLTLLGPHLTQSYLNAKLLTRLKEQAYGMESAFVQLHCGILEFTCRQTILWATPRILNWLTEYWPECGSSHEALPASIINWIHLEEAKLSTARHLDLPQQPLVIQRGTCTLSVRLLREADRRFLFFEERPDASNHKGLMALGLGHRESEVLGWTAQGKANGDIAVIMGISPKTVKKHLERIFAKLGVESRTAAAAKVLESSSFH